MATCSASVHQTGEMHLATQIHVYMYTSQVTMLHINNIIFLIAWNIPHSLATVPSLSIAECANETVEPVGLYVYTLYHSRKKLSPSMAGAEGGEPGKPRTTDAHSPPVLPTPASCINKHHNSYLPALISAIFRICRKLSHLMVKYVVAYQHCYGTHCLCMVYNDMDALDV